MSRRTGQRGTAFQNGRPKEWQPRLACYGRFWIDTQEGRKQKVIALGIRRTRSLAQRKLLEYIEANGINSKAAFIESTSPALTFRERAEDWISFMRTRRRKPVKPATLARWRYSLDKWLLPALGDRLLSEVDNAALKDVVEALATANLQPSSIISIVQVVKLVVASALTKEGEEIYPRKWNHDFIGLPIVDPTKQRRPTVTTAQLEAIISVLKPKYAALCRRIEERRCMAAGMV